MPSMSQIWRALHCDLVSLLVLCLPLNAATTKPPSSNQLGAKPPEMDTPVLFTGLPSVVELPARTLKSFLWKVDAGTECGSFTLVPYRDTLQAVHVTASGLGSVDFSRSGYKPQQNQIEIPELPATGTAVNFCVHGDFLLQPASSAQGKLIAFATGYKPARVDVRMARPSLAAWITALGWFVAILLPAALAGVFAFLSTWATNAVGQRREQRTAFRKLKDEKWDELADFFQTHLGNVLAQSKNGEEFMRNLRSELQSRGYWTSIPWKERDRIERFIKQREMSRVMSELGVLFVEWEKDLSGLHK